MRSPCLTVVLCASRDFPSDSLALQRASANGATTLDHPGPAQANLRPYMASVGGSERTRAESTTKGQSSVHSSSSQRHEHCRKNQGDLQSLSGRFLEGSPHSAPVEHQRLSNSFIRRTGHGRPPRMPIRRDRRMEEITFNENGPAAGRSTCVSASRDARDL